LGENFATLYQRCSTSQQKKELSDTYSAARYVLWKVGEQARRHERSVGAPAHQDLQMANTQLNTMLKNRGDVGAFLSLAAEAVRLASSLARRSEAPVNESKSGGA
jgi:hypothetical protein